MKKIYSLIVSLNLLFLLVGCKTTKVEDPKPVYKFTAKINNVDWSTYQIAYNASTYYISDCYYSTFSKSIYFQIVDPKSLNTFYGRIYISNPNSAVATYTLSSSSDSYAYFLLNSNDNPNSRANGTFSITKFSIDPNTFELTNFSARFSLTQIAEHSDGNTRTTTISSGEMNDVPNI